MKYWLIKSEPNEYSWSDLVKDGKSVWTGIRNYRARNNLKIMKVGDLAFFYHSNIGKDIVGIAKITKEFYQDPTTTEIAWVTVDFAPVKEIKKPINLQQIKETKELQDMELVKLSRLSVSEVKKEEFDLILKLTETKL
jgi:predicted RNA-binding protein with PUA-like domain